MESFAEVHHHHHILQRHHYAYRQHTQIRMESALMGGIKKEIGYVLADFQPNSDKEFLGIIEE